MSEWRAAALCTSVLLGVIRKARVKNLCRTGVNRANNQPRKAGANGGECEAGECVGEASDNVGEGGENVGEAGPDAAENVGEASPDEAGECVGEASECEYKYIAAWIYT